MTADVPDKASLQPAEALAGCRLLSPGALVGNSLKIKSVLSQSRNSVVYLARHLHLDQDVVLKVLALLDEAGDERRFLRFQQEAQLASSLSHPNIVKVLSTGSLDNGSPYIVMEAVKGKTLREELQVSGRLSSVVFHEVFSQLLAGLECAHQHNLLHRDIKPENILLAEEKDAAVLAKLTDFGIATLMEGSPEQGLTATADVLGSPAYMSPEQCQKGKLDERSDLYSAACVMYEALSGRTPFVGGTPFELMYKQIHEQVVPLSDFSPASPLDLCRLVEKGLSKDPAQRWASASELIGALCRLKTDVRASVLSGSRRMAVLAVVFTVLISVALVAFFAASQAGWLSSSPISARQAKHRVTFEDVQAATASCNYKLALELLSQMKDDPFVRDKAHLEMLFAYCYEELRDYRQALQHVLEAERQARLQEHQGRISEHSAHPYDTARLAIPGILIRLNDLSGAKKSIDEQEDRLKKLGSSNFIDLLNFQKCEYLLSTRQYRKAAASCRSLLENEHIDRDVRLSTMYDSMQASAFLKDYQAFQTSLSAFLQFYNSPGTGKIEKARALCEVVEVCLLAGDLKNADSNLQRCADLMKRAGEPDSPVMVRLLQFGALLDLKSGRLQDAESKLNRAVFMQDSIGEKQLLASELGLACAAYRRGDDARADLFMRKALGRGEEEWQCCTAALQSAEVEQFLAQKLKERGHLKEARRCLKQAESLPQLNEDERKQISGLLKSWR